MLRNALSKTVFWGVVIVILAGVPSFPAHAAAALDPVKLTTDLNNLVLQGNDLVAEMSKITLTEGTMDTQLATLETSTESYLNEVGAVFKAIAGAVGTSTFSVTSDMLNALQNLATIQASLGSGLLELSNVIANLSAGTSLAVLESSFATMLRLSDDIGVMADRILEMADKILIMADNIGIMADRIIATQVIQSVNLQVVVDAILQTQQNTILLIATLLG